MGVFSGLFQPQNALETNTMTTGTLEMILRSLVQSTSTGIAVTPDSALRASAVFACVKVISETIAQLPLILYRRRTDGGKDRVTDHPLYRIAGTKPNSFMDSFHLRQMMTAHTALRGNAVAYLNRVGAGRVAEIIPIHPDLVTIQMDSQKMERVYTIAMADGTKRTLAQSEVFHLMGLTLNGWSGVSPITYARESIGLSQATEKFGGKLFSNGAKMSGILTYPGRFKDAETSLKVGKAFDENANGENSHNTVVLEEGMKWQQVSMSSEDSQFLETRAFQIPEIARFFRMPLHKIGDLSKATFSNIEQQSLEFLTDCMGPWLVCFESALNTQLLTVSEQETYFFEFLVDGLLRSDIKTRYDAYSIGIQNTFLSPNEARAKENMNARLGGDEYSNPAITVKDVNQKEPTNVGKK